MTGYEQKCMKDAAAGLTKAALAHDRRETQHRDAGDADAADCHKDAAAGCRAGALGLTKACALPADGKGGSGYASTEETNANGDSQAKRSTQEIDSLLQKDRSDEFGKSVPADPIGDLARELAL
jgi:hypothetical protein